MAKSMTEMITSVIDKSSMTNCLPLSTLNISLLYLVSSEKGEHWLDAAGNGEILGAGTSDDSGWCSTLIDLTKVKSHSGEPNGKNVESISI